MRVLAVTPSYPRFLGDYHGRFVYNLCISLLEEGIDVKVLAPRSRSSQYLKSPIKVDRFPYMPSQRIEFLSESTMKGAPLRNLIQLPPYLVSAYLSLIAKSPSLIHAHLAIPMGFLAALSPHSVPLLVTCHGSDCTLPYNEPKYRPFIRFVFRKAEKIIAVSRFIANLARILGAKNVEVIPTGVDTKKFKPLKDKRRLLEELGLPEDRQVVGTLGRLVPGKRVEDIVRAAHIVTKKTDALFIIGGEGPIRPQLEKLADTSKDIVFLGEVFDAPKFHRLCDFFVLASIREGLSTVLQEAMASGSTPIAVDGFGCDELVTHGVNGYLFRPKSPCDLAKTLLKALEEPSLGYQARETIERSFDLQEASRRYVELYRELA